MPFTLLPIPLTQLRELARSVVPGEVADKYDEGALPPSFVAARSAAQLDAGESDDWCGTYYVVDESNRRIVGSCGFKRPPRNGCVEIGFGISPESRCRGAATAAVTQLVRIAFEHGMGRVLAEVLPENIASTRVVRKVGFKDTGMRADEDDEIVVQWVAQSSA